MFTDLSGRTIEARIVFVDSDRGTVCLNRKRGGEGNIDLHLLSADDRSYIKAWCAENCFLDERILKLQVKDVSSPWTTSGRGDPRDERRMSRYTLTLTNHGSNTISNLIADYTLHRVRVDYIDSTSHRIEVEEIPAGQSVEVTTHDKVTTWRKGVNQPDPITAVEFRVGRGTTDFKRLIYPEELSTKDFSWRPVYIENEDLPAPESYPERILTKEQLRAMSNTYVQAFQNGDYVAWRHLMEPMHPGSRSLEMAGFNHRAHYHHSMRVDDVEDCCVKVGVDSDFQHEQESWIMFSASGYIKYAPQLFEHPYSVAIRWIHGLEDDAVAIKRALYRMEKAGIPDFGFDIHGSDDAKSQAVDQIMAWIAGHKDHDVSEPYVPMPEEYFESLYETAQKMIAVLRSN